MNRKEICRYIESLEIKSALCHSMVYFPDEGRLALRNADMLLDQVFLFSRRWDMEQSAIPFRMEKMNWLASANGDEEWTFMLNRQEYLQDLLAAFYMTENDAYLDKWKEYILGWISANPVSGQYRSKAWRTIDTGIRCMSWVQGLLHLIALDKISEEELAQILLSLEEQTHSIRSRTMPKHLLSNWGVLQVTGILSYLLWFGEEGEFFSWSAGSLEEQLKLQVLEDGMHWEQSPLYHAQVLSSCLTVWHYCMEHPEKRAPDIRGTLCKMLQTVMISMQPGGNQLAKGDSDVTDARDLLVKGAILLEQPEWKYTGYEEADFDTAFFLGIPGITAYKKLEKKEPLAGLSENSGSIYYRSHWGTGANFWSIHNTALGSGHGHADLGHFNLVYNGIPFLIDPGRYTYCENDYVRLYLKSAAAHNTVTVDNDPFTIGSSSWEYRKAAEPVFTFSSEKDGAYYTEIGFLGFGKHGTPCLVIRKLLFVEPAVWILCDRIVMEGCHQLAKRYHFDSDVQVTVSGTKTSAAVSNTMLEIYHESDCTVNRAEDIQSKNYNGINNAVTVISIHPFIEESVTSSFIIGKNQKEETLIEKTGIWKIGEEEPLAAQEVTAFRITSGSKKQIAVLFHKENYEESFLFLADRQIPLYGKAVLLEERNGEWKAVRLKT
ncbi:heparinase II/III family protein [Metabacillus sp. GX 13764]|uniref:alginate lyase family protein n=1 Tax=Metabacillus kandeliae TaxID=2900151 RepID=UPI001E54C7DC|nr:alginate lyase family protein [Metabacillus kandeliae]MCD7035810.1 heparinase II/III family protein [Metabacillus kandeliae]